MRVVPISVESRDDEEIGFDDVVGRELDVAGGEEDPPDRRSLQAGIELPKELVHEFLMPDVRSCVHDELAADDLVEAALGKGGEILVSELAVVLGRHGGLSSSPHRLAPSPDGCTAGRRNSLQAGDHSREIAEFSKLKQSVAKIVGEWPLEADDTCQVVTTSRFRPARPWSGR